MVHLVCRILITMTYFIVLTNGQNLNDEFSSYELFSTVDISNLCKENEDWLVNVTYRNDFAPLIKMFIKTGQKIGLVCPYCDEIGRKKHILWYRVIGNNGDVDSRKFLRLSPNNDQRVFQKGNILFINNFLPIDSGTYICRPASYRKNDNHEYRKQDYQIIEGEMDLYHAYIREAPELYTYLLFYNFFVIENIEATQKFEELSYLLLPHQRDKNFTTRNYSIYIEWKEWSACEKCNQNSVRFRAGECKIGFKTKNQIDNITMWNNLTRKNSFHPCYTNSIFKKFELDFNQVASFIRQFYQLEYCRIDCKSYKKIKYNDSAKELMIDSSYSTKPKSISIDLNKTLTANRLSSLKRFRGEQVRLLCENQKFLKEGQLEWKKNGFRVLNRRFRFKNDLNELELLRLDYVDSGIYECYINSKLVASIELSIVANNKQIDQDDYNLSYDFVERYLTETFIIISCVFMIIIFLKYLNAEFLSKHDKLDEKNLIKNKRFQEISYFIKLNVDTFERDFLDDLFIKYNQK